MSRLFYHALESKRDNLKRNAIVIVSRSFHRIDAVALRDYALDDFAAMRGNDATALFERIPPRGGSEPIAIGMSFGIVIRIGIFTDERTQCPKEKLRDAN
ncbi:MAG: hypothetical protein AAF850_04105 [Pseudomonadota bacterium]